MGKNYAKKEEVSTGGITLKKSAEVTNRQIGHKLILSSSKEKVSKRNMKYRTIQSQSLFKDLVLLD